MSKSKGIRFSILLMLVGILPMLVTALAVGVVGINIINNSVTEGELEKLEATAYGMAEYFAYDIRSNGVVDYEEYSDHEYVENLKSMDIEQTLFQGDTRFLTSLKNADGSYNEGTQANADIWAQVKSGKTYSAENVEIGGKKYFVFYAPIYADDKESEVWGMAFAGTPMDTVNKVLNQALLSVVLICIGSVVFCVIVLLLISRPFNKNLKAIAGIAVQLASGNISHKSMLSSKCSDFNDIGNAMYKLQLQLEQSIGAIHDVSVELGEAVQVVDDLSVESASGAEQITNVVDQLADTAQSMAESVQDANAAMIKMGEAIENISENTSKAAERAAEMKEGNEKALEDMKSVYRSNEHSVDAISQISAQAEACNEAVEKITDAASTIADIASQTNLLALNASIEAARAGESGRGFAVVAENIRMLAEQSNVSANDIARSIGDVVSKVQECAKMAVDASELMNEQKQLVDEVSTGMEQLSNTVDRVVKDINVISEEAVNLDHAKESVLGDITELSAISEENAASAEEVTATIDTIATGISGTKDKSGEMRSMAGVLAEKIAFFS